MSFDFQSFGSIVAKMVVAHSGHGGWYETPDGLRCRRDDKIVCPSPAFMASALACGNCGEAYDPIAHRWKCPHCGWKDNCCEGEPQ